MAVERFASKARARIKAAERLPYFLVIRAETTLGEALIREGRLAEAETILSEATKTPKTVDAQATMCLSDAFGSLSDALRRQKRWAEARTAVQKAMQLLNDKEPTHLGALSTCLYQLAHIDMTEPEHDLAPTRLLLEDYIQKVDSSASVESRAKTILLCALGDIHSKEGKSELAQSAYLGAYRLRAQVSGEKDLETLELQCFMIANALDNDRELANYDHWEATLQVTLSTATQYYGPNNFATYQCHTLLGRLCSAKNRTGDAESHILSAVAIANSLKKGRERVSSQIDLGTTY